MTRRLLLTAAASVLALSGCAENTPYAPQSATQTAQDFGYTSTRLAPDRYRVMFAGNRFTDRGTVEDYLLRRAAELTRQNGYDGFTVVRRNVDENTTTDVDTYPAAGVGTYSTFAPTYGFYGTGVGYGTYDPYLGSPFPGTRIDVDRIDRYEAMAVIDMYRGTPPAGAGQSYDASQVLARVGNARSPDMM